MQLLRREALLAHREQLKAALEAETNPATALQLAVLLFFHRSKQCALHLPTKLISKAIEVLQQFLLPATFTTLSTFSASVVELLRIRAEAQREGGAGGSQREQELEAQLAEALPALKAAVFAPETEEEKNLAKAASAAARAKSGGGGEASNSKKKGGGGGGSSKDEKEDDAPAARRKGGKEEKEGKKGGKGEKAAHRGGRGDDDEADESAQSEEAGDAAPAAAGKGRRRRAQQ